MRKKSVQYIMNAQIATEQVLLTSVDKERIQKIAGLLRIIDKYKNIPDENVTIQIKRLITRAHELILYFDKKYFQVKAHEACVSLNILRTNLKVRYPYFFQVFLYLYSNQYIIRNSDMSDENMHQLSEVGAAELLGFIIGSSREMSDQPS